MAAKRKRAHPGVALIAPRTDKRMGWTARYIDPDTGKRKDEALPAGLKTAEAREQWAKRKLHTLTKRKVELEGGAARATGLGLGAVLKKYYDAHPHLRERTIEGYRGATAKLEAWAVGVKLGGADALTRAKLIDFKAWLVASPRKKMVPGQKRGQRVDGDKPRSVERVNSELRKVRTVLGYLVDADLLPGLKYDDLRRAMKRLPGTIERVEALKSAELQQILQAALDHDKATFAETRAEHVGQGRRSIGTTPRHKPIAPFVAFCMLTGCRFGEAVQATWGAVDLDAKGDDGRVVGEVHLQATATKTRRARTIDLAVSPALRSMLAAMKPSDAAPEALVFGLTRGEANTAARRMRSEYGAPKRFTWQALRRTAGTFLTNAPGIYGAASAYRSAKQLGHSVAVAEKHYVGLVRGIPADVRTLEDAMGVSDLVTRGV